MIFWYNSEENFNLMQSKYLHEIWSKLALSRINDIVALPNPNENILWTNFNKSHVQRNKLIKWNWMNYTIPHTHLNLKFKLKPKPKNSIKF